MSNCLFLLNDGDSHILLNSGTEALAMNDDTCGSVAPPPVVDPNAIDAGGGVSAGRFIDGAWQPAGQYSRARHAELLDELTADARAAAEAVRLAAEVEAQAKTERIAKYKATKAARIAALKRSLGLK